MGLSQAKNKDRDMAIILGASLDVNTFAEFVMRDEKGLLLSQGKIHEKLHKFLNENRTGVIEFPREHGKTTQLIIRAAFEIGKNPEIRIKIVSSSDDIAVKRGKALRELIESPGYCCIFPNIKQGRDWSDSNFTVKRASIFPDATVESCGLNSRATGGRADLILFDDPDDEQVVYSEAQRIRNVERVMNVWLNLLPPDGRAYLFSTPWHEGDIAGNLEKLWPLLRVPVEGMIPVWPERWNAEALIEKKRTIGSVSFARGYELVPMSLENSPIKGHWFKYWTQAPSLIVICIAVDLAISDKKGADYTVIGTIGKDSLNNCYLLDVIREHLDFPATLARITQTADATQARWGQAPVIGIESTAYQRAVPQALKSGKYIIRELTARGSKYERAAKLSPFIEGGKVFLRGDDSGRNVHESQRIVFEECCGFPVVSHDDTVDMLGYGVEMLQHLGPMSFYQGDRSRRPTAVDQLGGWM